jgi:hypothetical protein
LIVQLRVNTPPPKYTGNPRYFEKEGPTTVSKTNTYRNVGHNELTLYGNGKFQQVQQSVGNFSVGGFSLPNVTGQMPEIIYSGASNHSILIRKKGPNVGLNAQLLVDAETGMVMKYFSKNLRYIRRIIPKSISALKDLSEGKITKLQYYDAGGQRRSGFFLIQ